MSHIAKGPNSRPLIAIAATPVEAEALQARVARNMRHERADRIPAVRQAVRNGETSIDDVAISDSGKTLRWAEPQETELGEWLVPVPARHDRLRSREERTGEAGDIAPEWQEASTVEPAMLGDEVEHGGKRWRSTVDYNVWEPGVAGWREVVDDGYPAWLHPAGSLDAYAVGEIVIHGGKTWENITEANAAEPGVSGWREIAAEGYPAWVAPTGAHDAYPIGARVTHNGQDWENTGSDANVWEPGVFGWVVV